MKRGKQLVERFEVVAVVYEVIFPLSLLELLEEKMKYYSDNIIRCFTKEGKNKIILVVRSYSIPTGSARAFKACFINFSQGHERQKSRFKIRVIARIFRLEFSQALSLRISDKVKTDSPEVEFGPADYKKIGGKPQKQKIIQDFTVPIDGLKKFAKALSGFLPPALDEKTINDPWLL